MLPEWLVELRNLLALPGYEPRKKALQTWEQRWLIDLHWRQVVSDLDLRSSQTDLLERMGIHAKHGIGLALGKEMAVITCGPASLPYPGFSGMEIRADALAIRREPKTNG